MKINVGNEEVELDSEILNFNEASLNEFLTKDAGYYSYFHSKMIDAQYILTQHENALEATYSAKFREYKENGATDKMSEAMAKSDQDVVVIKEKVRNAKRCKDYLWGFLKSLDKAHENALNLGYNVRKEMNVFQNQHVKSLEDILN